MAVLSWDEIRSRALQFQNEWADETSENAESKTFWNEFFDVFGISRRRVATFEERVKIEGQTKFVDLLWKGKLLIEHKSKGRDLDKAYTQATNYFEGIKDRDLPQYILVSDFEHFRLYDLDDGEIHQFDLSDLYKNVQLFSFIAGYEKHDIKPQDPVNNKAAEMMGKIHDSLQSINYTGDDLDTLLVRLVFCLFADDTGIFNKGLFRDFLEDNTNEDGTDLAPKLQYLFEILDTPIGQRVIDDSIYNEFPYVNGSLFTKRTRTAVFNEEMRNILLECSNLDWGRISPAIFGSMFQSAMDREKRRQLGAHYTSEENIMKVIKPLFIDDLWNEFNRIKDLKRNKIRLLNDFQQKISGLKFFDPACGSGNFLIIAYREIRKLELEVLKYKNYEEYGYEAFQLDISLDFNSIIKCDVNQFYGIEIDSFSAQIAQVALWIIDHQMNIEASLYFGASFARLPLGEHANIVNDNSLDINWVNVLDSRDCDFVLGNPPFIGNSFLDDIQKKEVEKVASVLRTKGHLDYVACWYIKAAQYIYQKKHIKVAFVSTNSIVQGEHAINLWPYLIDEMELDIFFAHQTFKWTNEAKSNAAVYCIIIGFTYTKQVKEKKLFSYPDIQFEPNINNVSVINQYLLEAPIVFIKKRRTPISDAQKMEYGTKPTDGGHLILNAQEKKEIIEKNPLAKKYIRPYVGADDIINGKVRYCLYLKDCPARDLRNMPLVQERVEKVREMRLNSSAPSTNKWADYPTLFKQDAASDSDILIIPRVSSVQRSYVPIAYAEYPTVCSDSSFQIPNATHYLFGILVSKMHMLWLETIGGKLKGDFRYSNTMVYNNFVFPTVSEKEEDEITKAATNILDIRAKYIANGDNLADLYDNIAMPHDLRKAHYKLDLLVEKAYKSSGFENDIDRVARLFSLYEKKIMKNNNI
ncbi:Type II restriction/modification system, DNA methylase subunit YeeA [Carnobacterium alterfunditum]|uniref:site-specific DNA-methyltransferase (adenine-specific) n=2 Tax=Carnobacterium alterfunditum TaxID=28230 RepID=A0A1N6ILF0_9LACT|nr:DNA methyltransferase [Carnobacterium alterfunditum]SIO32860.1 Type II restriction/modification system, DNA methylase subunit YeeA [Carnobacterium alterfunditum]